MSSNNVQETTVDTTIVVHTYALAFGGSAIGTVEGPDSNRHGKKALVAGAVPGERVTATTLTESPKLIEATLKEVLDPSPNRTSPPCRYYSTCGGCQMQHIEPKVGRNLKRDLVESTLARQAGLDVAGKVTLIGEDLPYYSYRARIGVHLSPNGEIGFYRPKTGTVVDLESCKIASDQLNAALHALRQSAQYVAPY